MFSTTYLLNLSVYKDIHGKISEKYLDSKEKKKESKIII